MTRLSTVTLLAAWLFGVAMLVFGRSVLPAKYYNDSDRMAAISELSDPGRVSRSDLATVQFYRAFGIRGVGMTAVAGFLNLSVSFLLIYLLMRRRETAPWHGIVLFPWFAVLSIFLGMYSKEFLPVVAVGILCLGVRSGYGIALGAVAIAAYGALVRSYWLLVLAYAIAFSMAFSLRVGRSLRIVLLVSGVIASLALFHVATGFYLPDARTLLVAFRAGDPDSQTLVDNVLPNLSTLHDTANLFVGWLRFVVPVSLLTFGGIQHMAFCVLQIGSVAIVAYSMSRDRRTLASHGTVDRREYVALVSIGLAVTLVLSAFDGDFGAYARHQVALVPWLATVLAPSLARPSSAER